MDCEFHYYITYLIAARAGFEPDTASKLAYACQYVDDNSVKIEISKDTGAFYRNYISQTMNILKPRKKLFRIYPLFHFIPGDLNVPSSYRRDGAQHMLNTTPDSTNARAVMDRAVETRDIYRLAVASHAYSDTWAHQNFTGYFDSYNDMSGMLEKVAPDIGHASAFHAPDQPANVWHDERLLKENTRVQNKDRFLDAAAHLFDYYCGYLDRSGQGIEADRSGLLEDLSWAIGDDDEKNEFAGSRIARYVALASKDEYGGTALKRYQRLEWFSEAVEQDVRGGNDMEASVFDAVWFKDKFTWKDPEKYHETKWYRFQQAVKSHQKETLELLRRRVLVKMDLENL